MATHLSKLKKRNGDIILPITRSEGVILDDGTTVLQTKLDAIDLEISNKAPINNPTFTGTVSGVTASMVGLGNVTNESKETMFTNPTFTGTVSGVAINFPATIPSASWTGSSAPFSKSVTVNGILSTDTPIIDIVQTGTYATDQAMVTNWALIYRAVTSTDTITFYATAVPSADISIQVKVVR